MSEVKETYLVQLTFSLVVSAAAEGDHTLKKCLLTKLEELTDQQKLELELVLLQNAICDIDTVGAKELSELATIDIIEKVFEANE